MDSAGTTNESSRFNTTALSESEVSLKLNKRPAADGGSGGQAIWVFDIKGTVRHCYSCLAMTDWVQTAMGRQMAITHEINVTVLSKKKQDELNEPMCPPPDVRYDVPCEPRAQSWCRCISCCPACWSCETSSPA